MVFGKSGTVLIVDDEEHNLLIMSVELKDENYNVIEARGGQEALDVLEKEVRNIDVILLDRMMPGMNGLEVIKILKASDKFKDIPVIMQTAAASPQEVIEGIRAGVFHYLTKPYDAEVMSQLVKVAISEAREKAEMVGEMQNFNHSLKLMESGEFRFRTVREARNLSYLLATCFPDPETVVVGIAEIMVNAIEHGNLGVTYAEKTQFVKSMTLHDELDRRLALSEYKDRYAVVKCSKALDKVQLTITDMGNGFDWESYLTNSAERVLDPNGRGIAMAKLISFDDLDYVGCGNEVVCSVNIKQ